MEPDLCFLGLGVSRDQDARLDLSFAHQDALDLAAAFGGQQGGHFRTVQTKTLVDEQVTAP